MKAKFIVFTFIAAVLTACNSDEPSRKELIGTWSAEPASALEDIKSLTFIEDGSLIYRDKPNATIAYPGIYAELNYTVPDKNKLCFSGKKCIL